MGSDKRYNFTARCPNSNPGKIRVFGPKHIMEEVIKKISALSKKASTFKDKAEKVTESCRMIGRSWSGSSLIPILLSLANLAN